MSAERDRPIAVAMRAVVSKGMTNTAIAKAMGVSRTAVSGWLNGHRSPTAENLRWFLKVVGSNFREFEDHLRRAEGSPLQDSLIGAPSQFLAKMIRENLSPRVLDQVCTLADEVLLELAKKEPG